MDNDFENESYRYWQEKAISQLTLTNQFLTGISLAFLAFCFDQFNFKYFNLVESYKEINWSITCQALSVGFIMLSVILGIVVIFVRLIDFRITRNISLTKDRITSTYAENTKKGSSRKGEIFDLEFPKPKAIKMFEVVFFVIFRQIEMIKRKEIRTCIDIRKLNKRVNKLRWISFILGNISWKIPSLQLLMILVSLVCFVISLKLV